MKARARNERHGAETRASRFTQLLSMLQKMKADARAFLLAITPLCDGTGWGQGRFDRVDNMDGRHYV